jgi:hypothetical protein
MVSLAAFPASADDQITYVSKPDELAIFLNDVAFARDTLTVVGGSEALIVLPAQIFADTLIIREGETRTPSYRLNSNSGQTILYLNTSADTRDITLEYLMSGLSWTPSYDMWVFDETNVHLDFFAEVSNPWLSLKDVQATLIAGRVDTNQQLNAISSVTMNQYIAGYAQVDSNNAVSTGPISIQHIYPIGKITAEPGDTLNISILQNDLTARRLLLWNANYDQQATVIYKVSNTSDLPFAEGIVRSYQDGLFVGSDFIEQTPVGSEGSVTIGGLRNLRVNRAVSTNVIVKTVFDSDTRYEVTLTLSNFSEGDVQVQVIDQWNTYAQKFIFSQEPERTPDNLFRWNVTIPAGETITITYEYVVD